ncbi:50S ribosomal protein L10, partial [Candidatus Peregrinibacteria bacterium]|nr:50S ribosomal protein L10 [Candidatus Peregrinibacteria bacterium]
EAGFPLVEADDLEGPVACIFSFNDPLSGAQVAFKFGRDHDQVKLIGGVYDGKILSKEQAIELAKMPGREQLLGMFIGMLNAPLNKFAGMCSSPLGGFARALNQMADKGGFAKAPAAAAAPEAAPPTA